MPQPELDLEAWVTVAQAALLVGRDERQVYRWIDGHRLTPRKNDAGVTIVRYGALLKAEAGVRRGRPRS